MAWSATFVTRDRFLARANAPIAPANSRQPSPPPAGRCDLTAALVWAMRIAGRDVYILYYTGTTELDKVQSLYRPLSKYQVKGYRIVNFPL